MIRQVGVMSAHHEPQLVWTPHPVHDDSVHIMQGAVTCAALLHNNVNAFFMRSMAVEEDPCESLTLDTAAKGTKHTQGRSATLESAHKVCPQVLKWKMFAHHSAPPLTLRP